METTNKADIFTLSQYGNYEKFREIFDSRTVNDKDRNGSGLLHSSIAGRKFEIAKLIIESDIDINMTNANGQNAMHILAQEPCQNIEIAQMLLDRKIDINQIDKFGNNCIWVATFNCKGRNYEFPKLLVANNADINNKNKSGKSALDFAIQVGDQQLIAILNNEN